MTYNDDYTSLDNHIFNFHQIDIHASINIAKKRYINKIKHVAFNVYNINSSKQDYATFRERLDDEKKNYIYMCWFRIEDQFHEWVLIV